MQETGMKRIVLVELETWSKKRTKNEAFVEYEGVFIALWCHYGKVRDSQTMVSKTQNAHIPSCGSPVYRNKGCGFMTLGQ